VRDDDADVESDAAEERFRDRTPPRATRQRDASRDFDDRRIDDRSDDPGRAAAPSDDEPLGPELLPPAPSEG
jgi:hypothetical protein